MSRVMSWVVREGLVRFGLWRIGGTRWPCQSTGLCFKKSGQSQMHDHHVPTAACSDNELPTLRYSSAGRCDECAHQSPAPGTQHIWVGINPEHGEWMGGKAVP